MRIVMTKLNITAMYDVVGVEIGISCLETIMAMVPPKALKISH